MIRGPGTLRYGSQAIGGVVNSTNNRIPDALLAASGATATAGRNSARARCRASTTAAKAACCSTAVPATSPFTPTYSDGRPTTTAFRRIPISVAPEPAELPFATLPQRRMARAHQPPARLRAERHRADRRDADRRLQPAQGRDQPHPGAEERSDRDQADHRRPRRQQPAQRRHPQPRLLHQGSGLMPGAGVRAFASVKY